MSHIALPRDEQIAMCLVLKMLRRSDLLDSERLTLTLACFSTSTDDLWQRIRLNCDTVAVNVSGETNLKIA